MAHRGAHQPEISWWLQQGEQQCPHCGQWYAYEVEFRCTECDGPGCPHCTVVHAQGHLICPHCVPIKPALKRSRHGQ